MKHLNLRFPVLRSLLFWLVGLAVYGWLVYAAVHFFLIWWAS